MMRRLLASAIAAAIAQCCFAASSEEDLLLSFGEEEFLSIATGQKQLIAKAPAVATVITAEDIEAIGATTLEEILETVPGVHVSLSSTVLSPVISVRGIYTDKNPQVLTLVNGVPMTHLHLGDRGGRTSFPVRDIARVEVIRGPGSAVYGADALAGVINVITKSADQIGGVEFGVRGGSFDTTESWLLAGKRFGELEVAFSAQSLDTEGDDSRRIGSDSQTVFDNATAGLVPPASLAPGALETRNPEAIDVRLDLKYRDLQFRAWNWRQDDSGTGPGFALALDPKGYAQGDNYLFDLGWSTRALAPDTLLELRASYMDINVKTRQTLFPAGAVLPIGNDGNIDLANFVPMLFTDGYRGNPEFYEEHTRLESVLTWTALEAHTLRVAAGLAAQQESGEEAKNFGPGVLDLANRDCPGFICVVDGSLTDVSGTPYAFIEDQDRDVYFVSLQDQWQIANDWNLTAGVRYDDYSDFGSSVNPRLALVWDYSTDVTAKLLYGRAFRAPSFAELFLINNPIALGNEQLDPETSDTWELALDYRASFDWRLGINVFYYDIEDLIAFVPTGGGAQVAQNIGQQEGKGFEIETEWKPHEDVRVVANFALQKSEDETRGEDAARAPEQQFYVRGNWRFAHNWSLTGELNWVGDRNREPLDPREPIEDYTLANLSLERHEIMGRLDLGLRVKNLLDESASEPSPAAPVPAGSLVPDDFPLEERSYHITARLRF